MGNQVIIQRVEPGKTKSNDVNLPAAMADAGEKLKCEEMG
jgi:hypothetical protein